MTEVTENKPISLDQIERDLFEIEHDPDMDPNVLDEKRRYLFSWGPQIETEEDVARAAAMILEAKQTLADAKVAAAKYIKDRQAKLENRINIYGPRLEEWTREHLGDKARSMKVKSGTVGFRKIPGGALEIENESAVREWAEANLPEAINYGRAPLLKDKLKEALQKDGTRIPSCRLTEPSESFYVR